MKAGVKKVLGLPCAAGNDAEGSLSFCGTARCCSVWIMRRYSVEYTGKLLFVLPDAINGG